LEIKIQNFYDYTGVVCFHVSLGSGVVGSPGKHGRDLNLKLGTFQDAYTRRFIIRININS
jgi:hypothetical protein